MKLINKLIKDIEIVEDIKGVILSNIIVRIIDDETEQVLWCCKHGKFYGKLKNLKIDVEQDLNLVKILKEIEKGIRGLN